MTMVRITSPEMHDFSRYIAEISGIAIDPGKKYLLETRLQPVLEAQRCSSFYELLFSVKNEENSSLRSRVIDAIATNETYFFRDQTPFAILRHKIIPEIIDRKKRSNLPGKGQIRIWCAGCSTGQEVYSVIIAILETVPEIGNYDIRVLGTDISNKVIARASSGSYSQHEVERGLPAGLLRKYFEAEKGSWRVRDEVRMLAGFNRMNLLDPFYGIGPFDVIFCRNVAIYFSEQNKVELFRKIARILDREGYLIVGGSESLSEMAPQFSCHRHLKGMYYQRQDAAPAALPARRPAPVVQAVPGKGESVRSSLSLPGRPTAVPEGKGTRRMATAKDGRGSAAVAQAADPAQGRENNGQTKTLARRDDPGREAAIRVPAEETVDKPVSPLFAESLHDLPGEEQGLLVSIRNRRQRESSASAWEGKGKEEGKSLLERIHESREINEARDDNAEIL